MGVLSDFTLAGLTADGFKIVIVGADGSVVDRVTLPTSYDFVLVHPGDLAELLADGADSTWISLAADHRGEVIQALRRPAVEGTVASGSSTSKANTTGKFQRTGAIPGSMIRSSRRTDPFY